MIAWPNVWADERQKPQPGVTPFPPNPQPCREAMTHCAAENTKARRKRQRKNRNASLKRRRTDDETLDTNKTVKKPKLCSSRESRSALNSKDTSADVSVDDRQLSHSQRSASEQPKDAARHRSATEETWEVDSGFSSETSPPASGRSSPCHLTTVVALDCEMVGTGPSGRCSELARCSILDYHGNVLYDKYVQPCQPVTDYRTRWSGIQRHHLQNATPFAEAREEIRAVLEGKVVVGHSLYNDFEALDMLHPGHMIRDTGSTRLLGRLAGFPRGRCPSLKILAGKLLDRRIQVGRRGHCSVEDAQAALDLYKLVAGEWEQEMRERMKGRDAVLQPSSASSNHYMQDQYWPDHLTDLSQ